MSVAPVSSSMAATALPIDVLAAVFSATERVAATGEKYGSAFAPAVGVASVAADQGPATSEFLARTCTSQARAPSPLKVWVRVPEVHTS